MTTTNRLCYTVPKRYIQTRTFKNNVKILLADDCKNNICDLGCDLMVLFLWSITADIYEQRKNDGNGI